MVRILDLDLDIFVTPINQIHSARRPSDLDYEVLPIEKVDNFLIERCGLTEKSPTPGRVFEEHDELFDLIKGLVVSGVVSSPFELVHVDAHADLGAGQWKPYEYLLTDLMHREVKDRLDPVRGCEGLNRGTVVLFLAACEWLGKFHYVYHPDDGEDFSELFLDYDLDTEQLFLQIPKCSKESVQQCKPPFFSITDLRNRCELGPRIPFCLTELKDFNEPGFDFVFLTRSPGFTPPKADALFEEIRDSSARLRACRNVIRPPTSCPATPCCK